MNTIIAGNTSNASNSGYKSNASNACTAVISCNKVSGWYNLTIYPDISMISHEGCWWDILDDDNTYNTNIHLIQFIQVLQAIQVIQEIQTI